MRNFYDFPVIVQFENISVRKPIKLGRNNHTIWNTNKQGGWEDFKFSTEKYEEFENVIEGSDSNTNNMKNLEQILCKKKFTAFGKVQK